MFEVGDRVVCVDDGPTEVTLLDDVEWEPCPLVRGTVYVVLCCYAPYTVLIDSDGVETCLEDEVHLSVGVCAEDGLDAWDVSRFRKLRDISQSLRELRELAINCPALEPVARAREGK